MAKLGDLCLERYQSQKECYAYFNWIFNDIRYYYYFNQYKTSNFRNKIDAIHDPILRHIAIHLIANYDEAQKYFSENGKWQNNYACESLNKWLDNKKSYFTHALHCKGNVHLWDKTIEPLWNELESHYKNNGKSVNNIESLNKWCERYNLFRGHLELPNVLNPICYKHVPKDYKCVRPFPPTKCSLFNTCKTVKTYYEKCKSNGDVGNVSYLRSYFAQPIANGNSFFEGIQDVTFSRQVQNHCCSSLEYAVPISVCLSFFGTLLILFLFKKYTPLGTKFSYRGINKKRLRDNFNEELEYEENARSMIENTHSAPRINNIYYQSVRN
ncbi:variable surface protein [Plasmodium gonderi]|uniref:Variable surface protein n=1 Tax=Plasmodium gonderi TaxID=77519 RepID=A0A1Y1JPM2_PLAGO|nr:variable surface protein [Plasmodium gonderi]GAW82014.1 variable surface protein [Plasmodium gonderi]